MPTLRFLERALLAVLCAATVATLLVAGRNGLAPSQSPWSFALVLWAAFATAYLPVAVAAAVLSGTAALASRRWPRALHVPPVLLGVASLLFLGFVLSDNPKAIEGLRHLPPPARFQHGALAGAIAAVVALLATAVPHRRAQAAVRIGAATALVFTTVALWPWREPRVVAEKRVLPGELTRQRLLVVGIDGADWTYAEMLMARGELPNLKALRERGVWGPLATLRPTVSPSIWTTVFTGLPPEKHGIDGFTKLRLAGVDEPYPELRNVRGIGLREVEALLKSRGFITEIPVTSDMRKVPAIWNVASAYNSPMDVVEVWATWPAEPVLGHVLTDRVHFWPTDGPPTDRPEGVTHPPALYDEIADRIVARDEIGPDVARRYMELPETELAAIRTRGGEGWDVTRQYDDFLATFETARRLTLDLMARGRERRGAPDDTIVYLRMIDQFSHTSLGCSELVDVPDCTPEDRRRFARVVTEAYRDVDAALGEIVEAFGDGNVVVVSDHGWELQQMGDRQIYGHHAAPEGIFVAAGPAFGTGRVEGLGVFDMMPLFLRLKGFAVPSDLPGRVPQRVFAPSFLETHAVARIDSYGRREKLPPASVTGARDEEVMERLRALGYVD